MKSNKKQLIFLGLVVFSGQIVQAKVTNSSDNPDDRPELMRSVEDTGLSLPQFSATSLSSLSFKNLAFVSLPAHKNLTSLEKEKIRQEYKKLTQFKDAKKMDLKECKLAYTKAVQLGEYNDALYYLNRLMILEQDKKELQKLACQKGDLYVALKQPTKACKAYEAYCDMYPGANDTQDAHYNYLVALYAQKPRYDQDQEITHTIIRAAEKHMLEPTYQKYVAQVKAIHRSCYETLYQSEKNVLDFYLRHKKPVAAEGRYAYLKQKYYEDFPEYRAEILACGCDVALLQGNKSLYHERLAYFEKQFPAQRLAYKDKKRSFLAVM